MAQKPRTPRWSGWLKRKPSLLRPFPSLRMEELEARDVPAITYTWTGLGSTPNWSNPQNWTSPGPGFPLAPSGMAVVSEDLVFPDGTAQRNTVNDIAGGTFNSLVFSHSGSAGYTLSGQPLTLGLQGFPGTGFINVNASSFGNDIQLNMTLGTSTPSSPGFLQSFNVAGELKISGQLAGDVTGSLVKAGTGTLTLSGNNSAYHGAISVNPNSGTLAIMHASALGDTANGTTIGTNSILALDTVGGSIVETITLNGPGDGERTLFNRAGNNTIDGTLILGDADATDGINFNAADKTTLTINGVIQDTSAAGNILTKEGRGEIVLNAANTYRGLTKVNSGVLTVGNSFALGAQGSPANGTIVRSHPFEGQGQLRLASPTPTGFVILDEFLTLNGRGQSGLANVGSLTNTNAENTWAGPVTLGSPAPDGVAVTIGTGAGTLTISGVISTPNGIVNGSPSLTKEDFGVLIFNNANTYQCPTFVAEGTLIIRDSRSLGTAATTVQNGATLELQVEAGAGPNGSALNEFDDHGRNLSVDSVTLDAHRLEISNVLNLNGNGMLNRNGDGTRVGALYSQSGINVWTNTIMMQTDSGIGVALDPRPGHPTPDSTYFINDYSLTTTGTGGAIRALNNQRQALTKLQPGHLILPVANTYNGRTFIQAGWATVQDNRSLGARDLGLTQTTQPETFVYDGAAVHLRTLTPTSPPLVIDENFILSGIGPKLPYRFISQKGALMNIGGDNVVGVDSVTAPLWSTYVALNGNVGIGVEQIAPLAPGAGEAVSRLTMLSWTRDDATSGAASLSFPVVGAPVVTSTVRGGITKYGSKTLQLEGEGTYSLTTDIQEGILANRHNTGLGQSTSGTYSATANQQPEVYNQTTTIVQTAANLVFDSSNELTSGGISSGIQTAHEQLVVNGAGQQIAVSGFLDPAPTQFFLTFTNHLTDTFPASTRTTAGLPSGLTAADMEAELNKLPSVKGSEVQQVTTGATGTFTLTFNGQTTTIPAGGIPAGAAPGVVQNALLGLSSIRRHEIQNVVVTGGTAADFFTLTFNGQTTGLIPNGATNLVVQAALAPILGVCTVAAAAVPGGIRYTVTFDSPTVQFANQNQMTSTATGSLSVIISTVQDGFGGSVVVTPAAAPPGSTAYQITFGGELANTNVSQIIAAGTAIGPGAVQTLRDGVNGYIAVSESIGPGNGNRYTVTFPALRPDGGVNDLANVDLPPMTVSAPNGTLPVITTPLEGSASQSEIQQIDVVAAEASYTLTYKTQTTNPIPITAPALLVQNELNALSMLAADIGGQVLVSKSGNVYSALFNTAHSADTPRLVATPIPTPQGVPEITISGNVDVDGYVSQASVVSLSEDNTWRGPVVMNSGGRFATMHDTRLNFLGSVGDGTNPNAVGSDLVKRGQGEVLLAGLNSFRGTTWIDEGISTIANSGALGTTAGGTIVADKAQFQVQGSLTVAGEALTIQGSGVVDASTLKDKWFNVGPAPTNNVPTANSQAVSARITGVTTDPRDPNVIYVATAGGGAWKTKDRGITWNPLFDDTVDTAAVMYGGQIVVAPNDPNTVYFATGEANGGPNGSPIPGQQDDFAGTGVYVSNNAGVTWRLVTGPNGRNPIYGLSISKLIVDPTNAQRIYISTGTSSVINGGLFQVANNAYGTAVPGVYRYDGSGFAGTPDWVNLTGLPSANRATVPGQDPYTVAPGTPGPDDDYRIIFPQSNATWSDIALVAAARSPQLFGADPGNTVIENNAGTVWVLYAALGESQQRYFGGQGSEAIFNAVYRTEDPANAFPGGQGPGWWIGAGTNYPIAEVTSTKNTLGGTNIPAPTTPDARAISTYYDIGPESDPVAPAPPLNFHQPGRNEWIKISAVVTRYFNVNPTTGANTLPNGQTINAAIQVYGSNLGNTVDNWPYDPSGNALPTNQPFGHDHEFLDIQRSSWDGGLGAGWTKRLNLDGASFPATPFGTNPQAPAPKPASNAVGRYANVLSNPSVTRGLVDATPNADALLYLGGKDDLWRADPTILTVNSGTAVPWTTFSQAPGSPADYFHVMHWYTEAGQLRLLTGSDGGLWLSMTPTAATDGTFQNLNGTLGIGQFNNIDPHPTDINQALAAAYNSGLQRFAGGLAWNTQPIPSAGGDRIRDAGDVRYDVNNPQNAWATVGSNLYRTQNGGTTWELILTGIGAGDPIVGGVPDNSAPVYVDPVNRSRVLVGGAGILETRTSDAGVPTFVNLGGGTTVAMAPAVFQGAFVPDAQFPNVTDRLSNSPDPDTIWITDGTKVRITKNRGLVWVDRDPFANLFAYDITFGGNLANFDVTLMAALTGGPGFQLLPAPGSSANPSDFIDGNPIQNETQSLVVTATGGNYRLRLRTRAGAIVTTGDIPFNASTTQLQNAINAVLGPSGGSVTVAPGRTSNVITDIAVDPSNRDTAYITVRQRNGTLGRPTVFRTTDAGRSWQDISSNASNNPAVSYTNDTDVLVPDDSPGFPAPGTTAVSSVTVVAPPGDVVKKLTVTLNIQMDFDSDLAIYLRGPNGVRIPLSLRNPTGFGPNQDFIGTIFDDDAATSITTGNAPFTGPFQPQSPLSTFNGLDPNGTWSLEIDDNFPADQATLFDWTLDVTSAPQASGSLPDTQAWTVAVDPRTDTIYIGNDQGVWRLPNASSTTSYNWARFGDSLPDVQVHDLVLNQTLNTLTASTYGRGMYQLFLTDYQPSVGGIRVISGNSVWTGPLTITGDLTITADGTQEVQNGIAPASLDILGVITDSTPGNASVITKKGLGTVMFSGSNTYGGQTLVQQGVLRVKNPTALGVADADSNTVVADGAALELASDLRAEHVLLNGDGITFNGHATGVLRSVSNNNIYTGPLTLGTNVTIGVDRGTDLDPVINPGVRTDSSLRIGAHPTPVPASPVATATTTPGGGGQNEVQTITLPNASGFFNLTFNGATTGLLPRNATAAQVQFALNQLATIGGASGSVTVTSAPLGAGTRYTVTFDGGTLADTDVPQLIAGESAVAITGTTTPGDTSNSEVQTLTVLGATGAFNLVFNGATTGVLYAGATAADIAAALNGLTSIGGAGGSVVVTAAPFGAGTQYTITFGGSLANTDVPQITAGEAGTIVDGGGVFTLDKELGGALILASANAIGGQINVNQGAIRVEDPNALGSIGAFSGTKVLDGAALQIARNAITLVPTVVTGESLSLSGTGQDITGALRNVRSDLQTTGTNDNTWAGPITLALNPSFAPETNPESRIAIRVDDSRIAGLTDTLNIDTNIQQDSTQASFGLIKVGPGRLNLMQANSYTGTTEIGARIGARDFQGGSLRIENPNSLGPNALSNSVQTLSVVGFTGNYQLRFNGQTTGVLSAGILGVPNSGSDAQAVENALNALPAIGRAEQQTITANGGSYQLTFEGRTTGTIAAGASAITIQNELNLLSSIRRSEVQDVLVTSTDGYFTLSYQGDRTAPLPFDATTAAVQAELNLLPSIVPGSVTVGISPIAVPGATVYRVTFSGNANRDSIVAATYTTDTVQDGATGVPEIQQFALFSTRGTFTLSFNGLTTVPLAWNATLAEIQSAFNALPSVSGVNGTAALSDAPFGAGRLFTITFAGTLADRDLPEISANGVGGPVTAVNTIQDGLNGNVTVTGSSPNYLVTFGGDLGARDVALLAATPGSAATIATTRPGAGVIVNETPSVSGRVFTVTFQRPLDLAVIPQLQSVNVTTGLAVNVATSQVGGTGAIVNNTGGPGSLELAGDPLNTGSSINVIRNVVLNGTGVSGSIRVTSAAVAGGIEYTLVFDGALGNTDIPLVAAAGIDGATAVVTGVQDGSRAGNEIQRVTVTGGAGTFTISLNGRATTVLPFNAPAAQVQGVLNAISSLGGSAGALVNASGDNTYGGTITLGTNSHMGANPDTSLNVPVLRDPTALTVPAPTLTKTGQGTIAFPSANAYGGLTTVRDGVLAMQNPQGVGIGRNEVQVIRTISTNAGAFPGGFSLNFNGQQTAPLLFNTPATGGTTERDSVLNALLALTSVRRTEVQTVTLTGSASGTFTLSYQNAPTAALAFTASAGTVQSALEALPGIGVGNVTVLRSVNTFTITFAGALLYSNMDRIAAVGSGGTVAASAVTTDGLNGTVNVTTDIIPGGRQYTVTFGGDLSNMNLPEVVVESAMVFTGTQPFTATMATERNGSPGLPEQQTLIVAGPVGGYTLTFNGATTGRIDAAAPAAQIQAQLNALSTIATGGGSVSVVPAPFGSATRFTITFGGSLANGNVAQITAAVNEVQTVETFVTGAQSFNLTLNTPPFGSATTVNIPAGATAAQVEAALEAIATIRRNEVQDVVVTGTSGKFFIQVTVPGAGTQTAIDLDINSPTLQADALAKLEALTNVGPGNVTVALSIGVGTKTLRITFVNALGNRNLPLMGAGPMGASPLTAVVLGVQEGLAGDVIVTQTPDVPATARTRYTVEFTGDFAGQDVPQMTGASGTAPAFIGARTETDGNGAETQYLQITGTNGTFSISFRGFSTPTTPGLQLLFSATAADVEQALNALPSIGGAGGYVQVTKSGLSTAPGGAVFTIHFSRTLGVTNLPAITATGAGGVVPVVTTSNDGPEGTRVLDGATLQLNGNMTMDREVIYLNGQGFQNQGALNVNGGSVTWKALASNVQIPLFLDTDASIGTTLPTDTLTFELPISDEGEANDLDIYGPGTVIYTGSPTASFNGITYTQYTGTTWVHDGTLLLNRPGFNSILGPLVVGDATGAANSTVVRELVNNQIADTSTVRVNSDGLFDLNTFQDTIGDTTVVGGHIDTGVGGQLTTGFIDMTGGLIDIRNSAAVIATKNITMTGGTIVGGLSSTLIGVDLGMHALGAAPSTIAFGNGGTLAVRDVIMDGNSTIDFADGGAMVARDITATGGHIAFIDGGSLNASGNVSGTGAAFTFDDGGALNVGGNLSVTNGLVQFDFDGGLNVTGNASFNNSGLKFGDDGSSIVNGTFTATNGSKIEFGTTGIFAAGDTTLTNSDWTMGDAAAATTAKLTASTAKLDFGVGVTNGGPNTLASTVVNATDAEISFGDNSTFTADSITAAGGKIDFGETGRLGVAGTVNLSGTTVHFEDAGSFDALDVTGILNTLIDFVLNGILNVDDFVLAAGSALSMDKATATMSTMDLTDSAATFGPGSTISVAGRVDLTGSDLTIGSTGVDPSLLQAGNVTMDLGADGSHINLGNAGTALVGNIDAAGGSVVAGNDTLVNAGNVTSNDTDFTFGTTATFNADAVSITDAKMQFGTDGTFNTSGNLSLNNGEVALGDRNLQDPVFATQSISMINASKITLGAFAQGSSLGITMAGSTFTIGANARHTLGGDITASSTAADTAQILGPGTLDMGGSDRNTNVSGPRDVDLYVTALIDSSPTERLIKTGAGRLEFAPAGAGFSGPVSIFGGDVQVDTTIGVVNLKNATASLSGTGTVGRIDGAPANGAPAVGTVAPGVNWSANPVGILHTGNLIFGPATTYFVNISHTSAGNPVAGTDNDMLDVTGTVSLNNARLDGLFGAGVQLGDRFTIIQSTGLISGKFQELFGPNVAFIEGHKFAVEYNANSVVLVKVQATITSMTLTASLNPATQRQPVVLTATMTPEPGATTIPASNTVLFTFTNTSTLQTYTGTVNVIAGINQAVFNTNLNVQTGSPLLPGGLLPGGTYNVTAHYNGDPVDFLTADATLTGNPLVIEIPVFNTMTASEPVISPSNATSIGVKDSTLLNVTVLMERGQLTSWDLVIRDGSNAVVRTISNPTSPFGPAGPHTFVPISAVWDGRNTGGVVVPNGDYTIQAQFTDVFGNSGLSNTITIVVDDATPTISSFTNDSPNGVLSPALTGLTTPQVLHLTGTVGDPAFPNHPNGTFDSWTISIAPFGSGTPVRTITGTNTSVNAAWDGRNTSNVLVPDGVYVITIRTQDQAGNFTTSAGQTIVVLNNPPTIAASSNSATTYGDSITISAVITVLANDANVPAGVRDLLLGDNVEFYLNGSTLLGSAPITFNGTQYVASYSTTASQVIHAGIYNSVFARYTGSPDFIAGNSPNITHVVNKADLHVAGQNPVNRVYGDPNPPLDLASGNIVVTTADLRYADTAAGVITGSAETTATATSHVIPAGYPITQGTVAANSDYNLIWTDGRLFITKRDITLVIDDQERTVHAANPPFTFQGVTMVNGDIAMNVVSGITLTTTAGPNSPVGTYPIFAVGTATAQDYNIVNIVEGTLSVIPIPTPLLVGPGSGTAPIVKVYATDGDFQNQFLAFTPTFTGGVRTASGDFNRDGVMDFVVGTGPGTTAFVRVINGANGQDIFNVFPFESFTGGVFVTAGDIDGDGADELVITPDEGGGPRIVAYTGLTFQPMISYFGINDPSFRGGARAAVGDLNGDGFADVAVSAGFNGGPRLSLWDGKALANKQFTNLTGDFFAYDQSLRNGAYVAIGDIDGDGKGDLITGAGPGGAPHVKIYKGAELLNPAIGPANAGLLANFFAGDQQNRGGVRVAVKSFDGDLLADLATGVGDQGGSSFSTYLGVDLAAGDVDEYFGDDAFPGFGNGVFVG